MCGWSQAGKKREKRKAILMMPFVFVYRLFVFHHFNFYDFLSVTAAFLRSIFVFVDSIVLNGALTHTNAERERESSSK